MRPGAAGRAHRLPRPHVGILHHLGEQFSQRARRVQRDCQDAGQRADPECPHQDQRVDDVRHAAEQFQHAAEGEMHGAVRREVGRRRKAQQLRHHGAAQGRERRHLAGLEQQPQPDVQPVHPVGERTLRIGAGEQHWQPQIGHQLDQSTRRCAARRRSATRDTPRTPMPRAAAPRTATTPPPRPAISRARRRAWNAVSSDGARHVTGAGAAPPPAAACR